MTIINNRSTVARLAWSLWALAVALLAGTVIFSILNRDTDVSGSFGAIFDTFFFLALLVFPTVGAIVVSRRPENAIGWIFVGVGIPWALSGFLHEYAVYELFAAPGSLPGADIAAWLSSWLFAPPLFGMPPLLFLLFPGGRFLNWRQRAVGWLAIVGMLAIAASALRPGPLEEPPFEAVVNPAGIEGAYRSLDLVASVGWFALLFSIIAATTLMLLRLRRARGVERQQLKWIAGSAALFVLVIIGNLAGLAVGMPEEVGQLMILAAYSAIPIAAGYAILRHRLYDIDVVINRTLVYGSLTAILAGAYLGIVLLLQLALIPIAEGSELAIAGSTLVVAALFRPARRRIQAAVDRQFYRRKYDAQLTLEAFAARLRKEIDSTTLSAEVRAVVAETMHPAHVAMWLRS